MLAYQRVYKQILQALKDNTYPIGSLLPAEPELEKIYGVSRTTVRRAIAQLAEEGYVKVKQGHGTIVLRASIRQMHSSIPDCIISKTFFQFVT